MEVSNPLSLILSFALGETVVCWLCIVLDHTGVWGLHVVPADICSARRHAASQKIHAVHKPSYAVDFAKT